MATGKRCPFCGYAYRGAKCKRCPNVTIIDFPPSPTMFVSEGGRIKEVPPLPSVPKLVRVKRETCPNCQGKGEIAYMTGDSGPKTCSLCEGTGVKLAIPTLKINGKVTVNTYAVISRAVEEGVRYGWMRAHKHVDNPDEEHMCQEMENGVMNALSEVLNYGGEGDAE